MKFKTYEDISKKYPLKNEKQIYYIASESKIYIYNKDDLMLAKAKHPIGWYYIASNTWVYYDIQDVIWYDCYLYDGDTWQLGLDSWDGICPVEEEPFDKHNSKNEAPYRIFRTKQAAEDWAKYMVGPRLLEF